MAVRRQAERRAILHNARQAISRSLEVEEVYRATYQAVGQLMLNEAFAIASLDDGGQTVEAAYLMDAGAQAGAASARLDLAAVLSAAVEQLGQSL
jgi:hypothetical protein